MPIGVFGEGLKKNEKALESRKDNKGKENKKMATGVEFKFLKIEGGNETRIWKIIF